VEAIRCRVMQGTIVVKITWDARQVSKDKHQVEMILLIIPKGEEGRHYIRDVSSQKGFSASSIPVRHSGFVHRFLRLSALPIPYSLQKARNLGHFSINRSCSYLTLSSGNILCIYYLFRIAGFWSLVISLQLLRPSSKSASFLNAFGHPEHSVLQLGSVCNELLTNRFMNDNV
jgi:hypothetical protein